MYRLIVFIISVFLTNNYLYVCDQCIIPPWPQSLLFPIFSTAVLKHFHSPLLSTLSIWHYLLFKRSPGFLNSVVTFSSLLHGKKKQNNKGQTWFIAFADFCAVNIPNMADLKQLPHRILLYLSTDTDATTSVSIGFTHTHTHMSSTS